MISTPFLDRLPQPELARILTSIPKTPRVVELDGYWTPDRTFVAVPVIKHVRRLRNPAGDALSFVVGRWTIATADGRGRLHVDFVGGLPRAAEIAWRFASLLERDYVSVPWRELATDADRSDRARDERSAFEMMARYAAAQLDLLVDFRRDGTADGIKFAHERAWRKHLAATSRHAA